MEFDTRRAEKVYERSSKSGGFMFRTFGANNMHRLFGVVRFRRPKIHLVDNLQS